MRWGLLILVFQAIIALAQQPQPFSAQIVDSITTTPLPYDGNLGSDSSSTVFHHGKVYFSGTKLRIDIREVTEIWELETGTHYGLHPRSHEYGRAQSDPASNWGGWAPYDASDPCGNRPNLTCKRIGKGIFRGHICDKWKVSTNGVNRTIWIDEKTHITMKTETPGGVFGSTTVTLSKVQFGAQPGSLFEIPPNYKLLKPAGAPTSGKRP